MMAKGFITAAKWEKQIYINKRPAVVSILLLSTLLLFIITISLLLLLLFFFMCIVIIISSRSVSIEVTVKTVS